jgi:tetratricopeptide (TPR) repeat protein
MVNLGNSYLALHKTEEALRAFLAALPQVAPIHDTAALAHVHTGLGHIYFEQKKLSSALGHYRQAAEFWNELENKGEQALACERLGYVQYEMRDYSGAEESFSQQLKIQQGLDKPMGVAGAQSNLGMACLVQQKFEQALSHYQAALAIFEQRKDVIGMLGALQNIGRVYYELADYSKALDFYEKGKKLAESSQNKPALSNLLLGIGLVRVLFGQYDIALEYFKQSMTLAEELGDKSNLAAMQHNIGLVYANQAHFRLALEYYEKSLALSEQLQDKASTAQTLGNIGLVLNAMGDSMPAIEREQKALTLWEELKEGEGKAKVLGYLGSIYYGNSQFDNALDYFQKGLAEWEALADKMAISGTLSFIGDSFFRKRQFPQALESYEKSLTIQREFDNREAIAALECGIANVQLAMNQPEKALELAENAAELANRLHNSDIFWYARFKTGQAHRQLKNFDPAEQSLTESIQLIEEIRAEVGNEQNRVRFLDSRTAPLLALFEMKVEQGKFWEALAFAEKSRLWQMDELLGAHGRYNTQGLGEGEQLQEQQLRSQVFTWRTQLAKTRQHDPGNSVRIQELEQKHQQAQATYAAQEKILFAAHPDLAFLRLRAEPFSQARLRRWNVPPGQLILEFVMTEKKIFLVCLAKATAPGNAKSSGETGKPLSLPGWELKIIPLENLPSHLGDELLTYREMLRAQKDSHAQKALELFTSLLGPAQTWLRGKKQLLIVPDGILWLCPFQALVTTEGKYLIQDAAISYAPSLDIAVQMAQIHPSGKQPAERISLTQLSNTKPDSQSLQRFRDLQDADNPVVASSSSSSGRSESKVSYSSKDKRLSGAQAIKQVLQTPLPPGSLLELATPAVLDDYNPLYSFLLLSPSAESTVEAESFLEAWEILKLNWPGRAVLLQESIRPVKRVKAGEGLQAWCWALVSAGTPASLIRQWETGPAANEALRNEILPPLRGLPNRQARLEGSEALRRCILKWLQTPGQAHPGVWAAYQWLGCGF